MLEMKNLNKYGSFKDNVLKEASVLGYSELKITQIPNPEQNMVYLMICTSDSKNILDRKTRRLLENKFQALYHNELQFSISTEEAIKESYARTDSSWHATKCRMMLESGIPLKDLKPEEDLEAQFKSAIQNSKIMDNFDKDLWLLGARDKEDLAHKKSESIRLAILEEQKMEAFFPRCTTQNELHSYVTDKKSKSSMIFDTEHKEARKEQISYDEYYSEFTKPKINK